jgi:hypothetical protein
MGTLIPAHCLAIDGSGGKHRPSIGRRAVPAWLTEMQERELLQWADHRLRAIAAA